MKKLGVIGGVGPLSTAYFMEVVIKLTKAATDQEHIEMVILNATKIPDRTAYILDNTLESPVPAMCQYAKDLEKFGCEVIVTPCNTAHYFYKELSEATNAAFINMIDSTATTLLEKGAKKVGILATNGTISTELFQKSLLLKGIIPQIPSPINQQHIMDIIYKNVKANMPIRMDLFQATVDELKHSGCDHVILGCTELSVIKREFSLGEFYVDSLDVLAKCAIIECGYEVI